MRGCGGKRGQWSNLAGVEGACKRIGQRLCFNRAAQSCRAVGAARSWWRMEAPSYRVRGLHMPAGLRSLRTRATHSCASAGGTESGCARRLSDVERREEAQKMLAGGESSDSGPGGVGRVQKPVWRYGSAPPRFARDLSERRAHIWLISSPRGTASKRAPLPPPVAFPPHGHSSTNFANACRKNLDCSSQHHLGSSRYS
jgi:hypothetical protein